MNQKKRILAFLGVFLCCVTSVEGACPKLEGTYQCKLQDEITDHLVSIQQDRLDENEVFTVDWWESGSWSNQVWMVNGKEDVV